MTHLIWLQRDLRLADHAPLFKAIQRQQKLVIAYIHDPKLTLGEANSAWLAHSLVSLQKSIEAKGGDLLMLEGDFESCFECLLKEHSIQQVSYHYEVGKPFQVQQNLALNVCKKFKVSLQPFDQAWLPVDQVLSQKGGTYSVFTPFYKKLLTLLNQVALPLNEPQDLSACKLTQPSPLPADLITISQQPWAKQMLSHWQSDKGELTIGEDAALKRFNDFLQQDCNDYPDARDFPAQPSTSRLSTHLQFGELSMRQLLYRLQAAKSNPEYQVHALDVFIRQLSWREFGRYLLNFHPQLENEPFQAKFAQFPWDNRPDLIALWQHGQTGFPIIDAGMRELWHTGWMHNRVRMLVASWLTKNANQSWQHGQAWFANTLIDSDPANNAMGWQWVAGCGVDAAPYYRLFNPVVQSEKFDADAQYIKQWVPELKALPARYCHAPWLHRDSLAQYGFKLGENYPKPSLDLQLSRAQHLQRVETNKNYT
ncbi:deoxyribodipyrimidine photo-lyase [Thiomicrospira sp. R3]|uniref:cryptochrome/photolyase family protein n=1 Tax=Thiomicrospira sp. R3 TaxID=3035472 RepID=UPI00259AFD7B|nr:deoxyribodipyrimidine photo-lyase [Thiomicrospira sp. R3]WFE67781.1 deoxyribodipyrimidine photo-lyase [Thiomicrospira sp. R3]